MSTDESVLTTFEPRRDGIRWAVVERTAFPNGVAGVRPIRPFEHTRRRFWLRRSAVAYALSQSWSER